MSWEQLLAIRQYDRELRAEELSRPPLACPNDGTPLRTSPPGAGSELWCPHDGWRYPQDDHRPPA
jgi:hypothetical protein